MKTNLSVIPSVRPLVCPDVFLELDHKIFLNFGMVLQTHGVLRHKDGFFVKNAPEMREMNQNRIFEFIEKFGHQCFLEFYLQ